MIGREIEEYHVFLSSPGDVGVERDRVRAYVDDLNRTAATMWGVRFEVVGSEHHSSAGVGRPQELITDQTLERFEPSLVLVVVIMGQRFGTPSGRFGSGTEEEARWALDAHARSGHPEVKFFFRDVTTFVAPPDLDEAAAALDQWRNVRRFRDEIEGSHTALHRAHARQGPADR